MNSTPWSVLGRPKGPLMPLIFLNHRWRDDRLEHEEVLAQAALTRAEKQFGKTRDGILNASTLDASLFGGKKGTDTLIEVLKDGPLANKILIKDVATTWKKAFGDKGNTTLRRIETFTGTARTLSTGTLDIGWLGIQGSLLAAMHPAIYAKSAIKSIEAVINPNARLKYVNDNMMDIIEGIENGVDIGSSEFFIALERSGGLTRVANHLQNKFGETGGMARAIEVWREHVQPVGRLAAGFNMFLDVGKIELWKSLKPMRAATNSASETSPAELASNPKALMMVVSPSTAVVISVTPPTASIFAVVRIVVAASAFAAPAEIA